MEISIEQYILIYDTSGFYSNLIDKTIIKLPLHPNVCCDEFFDEIKSRYTDIILYEYDKWSDKKYSSKYSYLLKKYKNIIQIQFEFYVSKI